MVGNGVDDDTDASISASGDHACEFGLGTASTRQGVRDGLIVAPSHSVSTLGCPEQGQVFLTTTACQLL